MDMSRQLYASTALPLYPFEIFHSKTGIYRRHTLVQRINMEALYFKILCSYLDMLCQLLHGKGKKVKGKVVPVLN
jgi:hypothetical protein